MTGRRGRTLFVISVAAQGCILLGLALAARSGSTGLAVGDHLHFEVVVGGVAVNPLQWWDAQWIRTHVTEPLREGGTGLF